MLPKSAAVPGPTRLSISESIVTDDELLLASTNLSMFTLVAPEGTVAEAGLSEARLALTAPEDVEPPMFLSWLMFCEALISATLS